MISTSGYRHNQRIDNVHFALIKDGFAYLKSKPASMILYQKKGLSGKEG